MKEEVRMPTQYPPCDYCGRERFIKEQRRCIGADGSTARICLGCWDEAEWQKERRVKMERADDKLKAALARVTQGG